MLKIGICDDNQYTCAAIEKIILDYEKTSVLQMEIEIFFTGEDFIRFIKNEYSFDLVFLDIALGTTTGIEIARLIRNELDDYVSKIVFITAKNGYEQQLFDMQPFNFIRKPVDPKKVTRCIELAVKLLDIENKTFEYKQGFQVIKVSMKEIIYLESKLKQIKIVTHSGEQYFYGTLEAVKEKLPQTFVQPHRAFLINFDKVERVTKDTVFMINGLEIPISQRRVKYMRNMLLSNERKKVEC